MKRIQLRILDEYLGEQPVGDCFIEPTNNEDYPYVAHAPTMRVPGSISGTDKVYLATWAAFRSVYQHNVSCRSKRLKTIDSVVFPAMGAGFGGVPYKEVARQMSVAYSHYLSPPHRLDWDTVISRNKAICYDGNKQVVRHT